MDNRKDWTSRQTQLRKLLGAQATFEKAIELFLVQHSAVHSARISKGQAWSLEDEALQGLTEAQIRFCPRRGTNSIAWLLWHAARIEDITLTYLVLEQTQVIFKDNWNERLGLRLRDVGAGMTEWEVRDFSAQVSIPGLKVYRAAVGRNTRQGVLRLGAPQMKQVVPPQTIQQLVGEGSISANAPWLARFYSNRPKAFFLTRTATSHNFLHLSQASRLRTKLMSARPPL